MRRTVFIATISMLLTILVLALTFAIVHAQTAEELLKTPGLSSDQRAAIAEAIAKSNPAESIPEKIKGMLEWREMGEAFAETIKTLCQTLNVEVNAFLKSDVGKLTAAVIIYKMVGKDILRIFLYTAIWIGVTFIFFFSIKFLHMKKLVPGIKKQGEDDIQTTVAVDRFGWESSVVKNTSLIIHLVIWFAFTCVMAMNVI
ncbi:MAG: hypothetical protein R3267_04205 [Paenisporosarcina sp.]|nr:hypothetical protein [Paenisporosarcina sp.]